ncbi:hypothetical protein KFU94_54440 [Chloroflexi bacterium TSY]|nr:hypothetical protein [Chloroflexi bacterium TSY]
MKVAKFNLVTQWALVATNGSAQPNRQLQNFVPWLTVAEKVQVVEQILYVTKALPSAHDPPPHFPYRVALSSRV